MERRLTTILVADVVGYSRLMGQDEEGTLEALQALRKECSDPKIGEHHGRIVKSTGDGILVEFPSVVEAVRCALDIQKTMASRNADVPAERRMDLRIGINIGDVIVEGDDLFGDGVNVAARLEALAEPGGICMSGPAFDTVEGKLDLAFEDLGEIEVKNIARPLRVFNIHLDEVGGRKTTSLPRRTRMRIRRRAVIAAAGVVVMAIGAGLIAWLYLSKLDIEQTPSIAVLPFANQSGNSQDQYFSDGITEDIIAALGRFSNLMVLSRNTVFAYKDNLANPEQIARKLRVRYIVDGSVRKTGDRMRVSVQLSDAERGILLWSERFDADTDDLFTVQDEITHRVVGTLVGRLNLVEQERALAKPTSNLKAYDYLLRGRSYYHKNTRSENYKAQEMFEIAIELDPRFASAHAWLARTYLESALYGWTEWPDRYLERAYNLAQKAITLEDSSAIALTVLAAIQVSKNRYDLAMNEADRAIALNHNHPDGHAIRGKLMVLRGDTDEAIRSLETAERFNPQLVPSWSIYLGWAYFLNNRHEDAIRHLERMIVRNPEYTYAYVALATVYTETGQADNAAKAAANVRRGLPFFEARALAQQFRDASHRERIIKALQNAGLN